MELVVAMTYGKALFDAARELDHIQEVKEEIVQIDEIFSKENDFFGLLCNPAIPLGNKKTMIRKVFKGRISKEVYSFLLILLDKDRTFHYHRIVKEYIKLMDKYEGVGEGVIYSVVPLTEMQKEKFESETGKLMRENIKLRNETDPELIGGVKIMVDGKLIDASLRGRLESLRNQLK